MAATFTWKESNGVGEVESTATNINFGSTDSANLSTTAYPIVRPNNSFAKYIRAKFTGTWTTISNMKFWKSAGAYVTGELIVAGFNATYATPSETTTGDSAVPTAEPSQNVNSFEGNATIVYGASGVSGYTGYIRLQLQMTSGTPSGAVNQKTFIMQYDEV
jgi:hypothetical protein